MPLTKESSIVVLINTNRRGYSGNLQHGKNAVLTDFEKCEDWEFTKALTAHGEQWICLGIYCGRKSKVETLKCFVKYFTFPLGLILHRKRFGKILAWQQFFGLNYAFFSRLFHLKKRSKLYVMTFIYKPKHGLVGKMYGGYMRYIVKSKYIDKLICFSSAECDYYKNLFGVDKFVYVPLGKDPMDVSDKDIDDDGYIFSTGRSNRDYDFLIESLKDTEYKVRIACGLWQYDKELPTNVTLLHNCYGKAMAAEMAHSHCVVIPLRDLNISSGQLVILQAMQLGKPIIVTKSNGVADYITQGVNGYMMENTRTDLMEFLGKIANKEVYKQISDNAKATFWRNHSLSAMANNIIESVIKC